MSSTKEQLKEYLKDLSFPSGRALSIGCKNDDRKYFNQADFTEWKTLDNDKDNKPDYLWDINDSIWEDGVGVEIGNSFDYVFALELFEYVFDPVTAHKNIADLMKTNGLYIGSYHFLYPVHNPVKKDYLRYTQEAIEKYLEMSGFGRINYQARIAGLKLKEFYKEEGMRMAESEARHDIVGWIVQAEKVH